MNSPPRSQDMLHTRRSPTTSPKENIALNLDDVCDKDEHLSPVPMKNNPIIIFSLPNSEPSTPFNKLSAGIDSAHHDIYETPICTPSNNVYKIMDVEIGNTKDGFVKFVPTNYLPFKFKNYSNPDNSKSNILYGPGKKWNFYPGSKPSTSSPEDNFANISQNKVIPENTNIELIKDEKHTQLFQLDLRKFRVASKLAIEISIEQFLTITNRNNQKNAADKNKLQEFVNILKKNNGDASSLLSLEELYDYKGTR